jgi:cleavage and polyadenylation specificity factor subunit 6/7
MSLFLVLFNFLIIIVYKWTSSEDVKKAIQLLGVLDVLDVKIYECRANGQSKGYCLVSFASEGSIKLVSENLEKADIQGRQPVVKPDLKTSISFVSYTN